MTNNNKVSSKKTRAGETIVGHIYPGSDLIPSIYKICEKNDIENGYISMLIGSLKKASFVYAKAEENSKIGIRYSEPLKKEGPFEFLSGQGLIGRKDDGNRVVHLHGMFSNEKMEIQGGHLIEKGNIVLATIEIVINRLENINLIKSYDKETGFPLFKIEGE